MIDLLVVAVLVVAWLFLTGWLWFRAPWARLIVILAGVLQALALAGLSAFYSLASFAQGPARPVWTWENTTAGALVLSLASIGLLTGVLIAPVPRPSLRRLPSPVVERRYLDEVGRLAVPLAAVATAAWSIGRGISGLLSRATYLPAAEVPGLAAASGAMLPVAFFALNFATGRRLYKNTAFALIVLVAFASTSRLLALLPILSMLAMLLQGRLTRYKVSLLGGTAIVALGAVLGLRALASSHGLFPYVAILVADPSVVAVGAGYAVENLVFAVPLAGAVYHRAGAQQGGLITSLNPLPGAFTDWDLISPSLRIHNFIPFNGVGELAAQSLWLLVGCFAILGVVMSWALVSFESRPNVLRLLALACFVVATVLLLQYNLRSGARLVYLGSAVLILSYWAQSGVRESA